MLILVLSNAVQVTEQICKLLDRNLMALRADEYPGPRPHSITEDFALRPAHAIEQPLEEEGHCQSLDLDCPLRGRLVDPLEIHKPREQGASPDFVFGGGIDP